MFKGSVQYKTKIGCFFTLVVLFFLLVNLIGLVTVYIDGSR